MDIPDDVKRKVEQFKIEKHPKSICIANYKGGVGKTTVTTLLGYYLAHRGYKVLLFDIDPQCSLSLAVGYDPEVVNKTDFTIYHLVKPKRWSTITKVKFRQYIDDVPDAYAPDTLKIIKGSFDVDELDIIVTRELVENPSAETMLFGYCTNMLNEFTDFDYILVDCPPNKMYLTQAMLRACSYYLAVTIPDKISIFGMPRLLRWVKEIDEKSRPKFLGCVLNGINRAGGYEYGTQNQQRATEELYDSIKKELTSVERKIIETHPIIERIPRLDVISRFLSQGADKMAWFDFRHQSSEQKSVADIMMNFTNRIENRIKDYAKA
ncbi:MAG: ParA family protein [Bacteroidales bacterium]|nr:ParA family protein [Bacteroidales bacterium]